MAVVGDYSRGIVLTGVPVAWVLEVFENDGVGVAIESSNHAVAVTAGYFRFLFNNLKEIQYKIVRTSAAENVEYIDIERADAAIIQFTKTNVTIDGVADTVKTATEDEQTGLAEITLITNECDLDSSNPTEMEERIRDAELRYFLICIPTGFTWDTRNVAATKNADGFMYMYGKISSNQEVTLASGAVAYSITFAAVLPESALGTEGGSAPAAALTAALQAFTPWVAIPLEPASLSINILPITITATEAGIISAGKMGIEKGTFA